MLPADAAVPSRQLKQLLLLSVASGIVPPLQIEQELEPGAAWYPGEQLEHEALLSSLLLPPAHCAQLSLVPSLNMPALQSLQELDASPAYLPAWQSSHWELPTAAALPGAQSVHVS